MFDRFEAFGAKDQTDSTAATNSEGKTTDEVENIAVNGGTKAKTKKAAKKVDIDDQDHDIKMPDMYTQKKLIPHCFGVYQPHL